MDSPQSPYRLCIVGAAGRMGRNVARLLPQHANLRLTAAVDSNPQVIGHDLGTLTGIGKLGVTVTDAAAEAFAQADVVVDFSAPPACSRLLPLCVARRLPYIVASTGLSATEHAAIAQAAATLPVLVAANLSVGVNIMFELVELAAQRAGAAFDIEIAEIHHRFKRDAPSGTALALGEAVQRGRGDVTAVMGRHGVSPARGATELGYAALRGGDVSGDHTVYLLGDGERLEITHRSTNAEIFAAGALRAALWLLERAPGRYSMADVLRARTHHP